MEKYYFFSKVASEISTNRTQAICAFCHNKKSQNITGADPFTQNEPAPFVIYVFR